MFRDTSGFAIQPHNYYGDENKNKVLITNFREYGEKRRLEEENNFELNISYRDSVVLPHYKSSFTIEYSNLDFLLLPINSFQVKMEGVDDQWKMVTENFQTYMGLQPGEYIFKIKSPEDPLGVNESRLYLKIRPPFWHTWWFYVLVAIVGVLLLFRLRFYLIRWKNLSRELEKQKRIISQFNYDETFPLRQEEVSDKDDAFLTELNKVISSCIDNSDFGVEMLSQKMNMSHSALYKKIRELTNVSVSEFIIDYRLNLASKLLESQPLRISEVSFLVGYNDSKYFSKEFKRKFKITPSEYAKNKS